METYAQTTVSRLKIWIRHPENDLICIIFVIDVVSVSFYLSLVVFPFILCILFDSSINDIILSVCLHPKQNIYCLIKQPVYGLWAMYSDQLTLWSLLGSVTFVCNNIYKNNLKSEKMMSIINANKWAKQSRKRPKLNARDWKSDFIKIQNRVKKNWKKKNYFVLGTTHQSNAIFIIPNDWATNVFNRFPNHNPPISNL